MEIFTEIELKKAKEIIRSGLSKAAKSFGAFLKTEIRLDLGDDFTISENVLKINMDTKSDDIYLLTSELLGELKGASYLIFSKNEVKSIMTSIYPNKNFAEEKYNKKSKSLILETDNIITAGLISQFANVFDYRTYGGVPHLDIVDHKEAERIIFEGTNKNEFLLGFKAILSSDGGDINADFIWSVDKAFVEGVKKVVKIGK